MRTLCLEQEHASYYGVKTTLDGNPSDNGVFACSCIWGCSYLAGNHLGKLFTTIILLELVFKHFRSLDTRQNTKKDDYEPIKQKSLERGHFTMSALQFSW